MTPWRCCSAARSPALNLLGVTCVMGNVELNKVVPNTLKVLEVAGRTDVPVARGMYQPLNEKQYNAKGVHGDDGMGNLGLPPAQRREEPVHAVEFLRRTLMEAPEPITLIPLAPLTNIAILLLQHPEVMPKIQQMYIMGGAIGMGNAAPATAEFNVRQDPEAADIVFRSGLPIVMYGLEVFRQVTFTRAEAQGLINAGKPAASKLAGQLLTFFMNNFNREAAGIGDAGCVASFIDPAGLSIEPYPVRVELTGTWTHGPNRHRPPPRHHRPADRPGSRPWAPCWMWPWISRPDRYREIFPPCDFELIQTCFYKWNVLHINELNAFPLKSIGL